MSNSVSNKIQINGKKIVIIGDGPMALLTAIKLKQKGVTDVTIVGPRLDEFKRSGDYDQAVFDTVSSAIAPLLVKPSSGMHIKDIERGLYRHASELGVTMIKKKFDQFSNNKQLILTDNDPTVEAQSIHADIVFDCTGTKRDVINKFNFDHPKEGPRFDIKSVSPLDKKSYALVRILADREDFKMLYDFDVNSSKIINPLAYALAMEEMRKLGWKHYTMPMRNISIIEKKESQDLKANVFMEVPEGLNEKDIEKFMKILLKFSRNNPADKSDPKYRLQHHATEKDTLQKQVISSFSTDPHQTTPGYYKGDTDYPMIFHAGDATADLPIITGKSLIYGVNRLNAALETFTFDAGEIKEINLAQFDESFNTGLKNCTDILEESARKIIKQNENFNKLTIYQIYKKACVQCKDLQDLDIIKNGLENVQNEYATELFQNGKYHLENISDEKMGLNTKISGFEDSLNQGLAYLRGAHEKAASRTLIIEIQKSLEDVAKQLCMLGDHYFYQTPNPNYKSAELYYILALEIDKYLFPNSHFENKLILYSQLIIAYSKQEKFIDVLKMAEELDDKKITSRININENKLILEKNYYHIALAMLHKGDKMVEQAPFDKNEFKKLQDEINNLIDKIIQNNKNSAFAKLLSNKLNELSNKAADQLTIKRNI